MISLASGLRFIVSDIQFEQTVLIKLASIQPTVGFGFCLAGRFEARADCFKAPLAIQKGESGFFTFPKPMDVFEKVGSRQLHRVYLMLERACLLTMAQGDEDRFYPVLKSLEKKNSVVCPIT